jgi:hypothetical protein
MSRVNGDFRCQRQHFLPAPPPACATKRYRRPPPKQPWLRRPGKHYSMSDKLEWNVYKAGMSTVW